MNPEKAYRTEPVSDAYGSFTYLRIYAKEVSPATAYLRTYSHPTTYMKAPDGNSMDIQKLGLPRL